MTIKISRFIGVVLLVVVVNILLIVSVSGTVSGYKDQSYMNGLKLRNGDLVFRNGYGLISDWFRKCSLKDPRYSHAGIIIYKNNQPFVAHILQKEYGNPLVVEKLSSFWDKGVCDRGAVYRPDLSEEGAEELVAAVKVDMNTSLRYDFDFNMDDPSGYYCSEWIRAKFIFVSGDENYFPFSNIEDFRYIATDDLYLNKHTACIFKFNY